MCLIVEDGVALGLGQFMYMHDQGVEARPAFGLEHTRHGAAIGGVSAQAVDRLRGERDKSALAQYARGVGDRVVVRATDSRFGPGFHGRLYSEVSAVLSPSGRR